MAETLLSFGVEKLWALLVRESDRFKGVDGQLTALKSDVNLLRSFMKDADAKKRANETVRNCVEEIKEIVFDAEDVIQTFLIKKETEQTNGFRKRMRRLAFTMANRRELVSDMEGISKRIFKVICDMQSFGVQQMIVDRGLYSHPLQERQREMRKTFPSSSESNLVGLEENVKKLVGYLVEEESIQVVSICGMGGIGKTTLARQVFNHEMVKNHFDGVAWVCISQEFTRKYVWQTILQMLSSTDGEHREFNMAEDELQKTLFRLLGTNNYLIVLDDMWEAEDWDRIKHVFPHTKGWKVLVTSRNDGVTLHADPTCVTFKPACLTLEESWTFFQSIAFPRKGTTEYKIDEEMEEMGKQMIKHCGGLPLAVKVLGGLLATQCTLHEWKTVHENIKSHIVGDTCSSNKNFSSVYNILYLSFEELPIYLKHCFLYLAHFPEDYAIDVDELAYYWSAEGIPTPRYYNGATIRDIADQYIEELVKRNMVISERDARTFRFETCHLHDMLREVCLLKAEEEDYVHIVDTSNVISSGSSQSPCKSRRLVIHSSDDTIVMKGYIKNPKLRSLLIIEQFHGLSWMASGLCFERLQLMRVLDLTKARFEGGKLPSNIGKLIHLRYLNLQHAHVTHLPFSMRNLKQLLFLNLLVSGYPIYVPNIFKEMRELKYLRLPDDMKDDTKLELGNLINLETLEKFSTKYCSVTDLHGMTRLARLSISVRDGCTLETLFSSLYKLRHLKELVIDGMTIRDLYGYNYDKVLCGRRMVCSRGGFPQLQKLFLHGLEELEEWIVEECSMPLLHTLSIHCCTELEELPDGLRFITSLKDLTIFPTSWEFTTKLKRGGEDYYKVQHIPLVGLDFGGYIGYI